MLNTFLLLAIGFVLEGSPDLNSRTATNLPEILVSTEWLEDNLSDPLMVILHYGKQADFEKKHIPGARLISLKDMLVDSDQGLRHELPDSLKIEQVLRAWGINNNSKIIICYGDKNALPMAARLFFTLDYAGLGERVAILNGGVPLWKSEKRPLSQKQSKYKEGNIRININHDVLADRNWVYANLNNRMVTIVDARPEEQYSGSAEDHNSSRKGHIEGAVNIPFSWLSPKNVPYILKSEKEMAKLFEEKSIPAGSEMVVYCGSGIWASPVYFAAKLLGYKVRLYDTSFQEWGNNMSLPVTTPDNIKK